MKNLIWLLFLPLAFQACVEENIDNAPLATQNDVIPQQLYTNADDPTPINTQVVANYWIQQHELPATMTFTDFQLGKGEPTDRDKDYYILKAKTSDGKLSIASKVKLINGRHIVLGETCSCEATNCDSGGEVWAMCSCTPCQPVGDCKKKHTVTSDDMALLGASN